MKFDSQTREKSLGILKWIDFFKKNWHKYSIYLKKNVIIIIRSLFFILFQIKSLHSFDSFYVSMKIDKMELIHFIVINSLRFNFCFILWSSFFRANNLSSIYDFLLCLIILSVFFFCLFFNSLNLISLFWFIFVLNHWKQLSNASFFFAIV